MKSVALLAAIALVAPHAAFADDGTKAAKAHVEKAKKLFNLGKFDDALSEYQKAYDAKPLPKLLFNIAQCYRNLGQVDQALFTYKSYLQNVPNASNRTEVEGTIDQLEEEKARGESERLKLTPPKQDPSEPQLEPRTSDTPVYKKWWFWTTIAVVAIGGGVGIYELTRPAGGISTDLGSVQFPK
jgi:tetratricopeptide (TPR) repeat protein